MRPASVDSNCSVFSYRLFFFSGVLQSSDASFGKIPRSRSRVLGQLFDKVRPNLQDRERSKSVTPLDKSNSQTHLKFKKAPHTDTHPLSVQGLEAQIKEKIQEICRRPSAQRSKSDTETEKNCSQPDRNLSKSDILNEIGGSMNKQKITYKKIGKW